MASDPNGLYNFRKSKISSKEISSSTNLAFTSTLSSLIATSAPSQQPGRIRPSKKKEDIFASHNKNTKKRAARDLETEEPAGQVHKRNVETVDDATLKRSRRKLEEKARKYRHMKEGGDDAAAEGLIDFDRKWAERRRDGKEDESSEAESDDGMDEIVDYEDEYGRARRGTRAEAERMERRKANKERGAAELERLSARPAMPEKLIYGDTIQAEAFNPDDETAEKMEALARKRDRSATPPDMKHYEADKEFRIKGQGFYVFSKDEGMREKEMAALEEERRETERRREERELKKEERKRELAERKRVIGEKRAKKQADSFLEKLGDDLATPGA